MAKKHLTILHSNDMHGDFLPKEIDGKHNGGIARLSGYVRKVRAEEKNVIYAMAGDMFRGSIIDEEYLGLSTINLVNLLGVDVATLGNHEVDYGLSHLLFLEKCARFPIINANMFVTLNRTRLFTPCLNIDIDGMRILFIGILTEEVLASTRSERVIGTFIDIEQAAREVNVICDNYRTRNTDLTILLTHIGIEEDRKLAALLSKDAGVDIIIGGHSHTFMDAPEAVNGIPIVQAGTGTGQIGRFDLEYDTWFHRLTKMDWQAVSLDEDVCSEDETMKLMLMSFKNETDEKYLRIITHLNRKLTHPTRIEETELGNLYADILQDESSFDITFMGTGSIRKKEFGPLITRQEMIENTPFDDSLHMLKVTGAQLKKMLLYIFRDEAWEGHTEFYNFSRGCHFVYRKSTHTLETCEFRGKPVEDDQEILIAMLKYHFENFDEFFGIPRSLVEQNMKARTIAISVNNIYEEYFATHPNLDSHVEGRIVILD